MAKRSAMLVLDSQKLELSIPFRDLYDFASATLKKIRFNAAKNFIQNEKKKGTDVKVVALDGRTEDFFKKENIGYIKGSDIAEGLYDIKNGEISFKFLRNIIKTIEEIDSQATYRGILLPDLDEKNLWRSFIYPTLKSVDVFSGLIKKYRPQEAIILNRAHFYQKLFMLTAQSKGLVVDDMSGTFSHLPWKAKEYAIKNLGFLNYPSYFRGLKAKSQAAGKKTKKKIIVAHDYISPKKVIPWAKKLAKKYEVVYVGTKENGNEFEKAGIKYRKLQDYATETVLSSIRVQKTIFRKDYKHIFASF